MPSHFFEQLQLADWQRPVARPLLADVQLRLTYLADVGRWLPRARSIAAHAQCGEAQRVALTATLGSSLVDMLYVLDEPSIGLHPADVRAVGGGDRTTSAIVATRWSSSSTKTKSFGGPTMSSSSGRAPATTAAASFFKARRRNCRPRATAAPAIGWLVGVL